MAFMFKITYNLKKEDFIRKGINNFVIKHAKQIHSVLNYWISVKA